MLIPVSLTILYLHTHMAVYPQSRDAVINNNPAGKL